MCLYDKHFFGTDAEKPITVYKVFYLKNNTFISPFFGKKWKHKAHRLPVRIYPEHVQSDVHAIPNGEYGLVFAAESGFIHSFEKLTDARCLMHTIGRRQMGDIILARCTIEQGVRYHKGRDHNFCRGYASRELIVDEIIEQIPRNEPTKFWKMVWKLRKWYNKLNYEKDWKKGEVV